RGDGAINPARHSNHNPRFGRRFIEVKTVHKRGIADLAAIIQRYPIVFICRDDLDFCSPKGEMIKQLGL
ncbi:hypothetical protein, partial [Escherichia coli]|uniref:hypothetical protein n=1 Tax=Escherichia coli TaxID=562 RepID=UPI003CE51C24